MSRGGHEAPAATGGGGGNLPTRESDAALRKLLALPGNERCADCRERRPKWASVNLGIFVCLRCSGCHRGLGVHISKVRSVTLDAWSRRDLEQLEQCGNAASNRAYLARAPPHLAVPRSGSEMSELQAFIVRKYVEKEWHASQPQSVGRLPDGASPRQPPPEEAEPPPSAFLAGADPYTESAVYAAAAFATAGVGGDPFGQPAFDGASPGRRSPTPVPEDQDGTPEDGDPFAGSPFGRGEGTAAAEFSAADPFGDQTGAATGATQRRSAPEEQEEAEEEEAAGYETLFFAGGAPLGLGLVARACFRP